MTQGVEMLPCPFCGGEDAFVEQSTFASSYVICNDCMARGPDETQDSDEEDEPGRAGAITVWNTRPARPAAAGSVREAAERLLTTMTKRALRGRDHVPSMRDEQDAASVLRAALAAAPTPDAAATVDPVREAAKPWADYHGDLPDYDHPLRPVYESGIQYAVELLAKELGVTEWVPCDGTEEFDGDLGGTLMNIVLAAMPEDEHGDPIHPRDLLALLAAPDAAASALLAKHVAGVMAEDGGCWTACSGCQESDEGYVSQKYYPYSPIFKCQPGGGCSECGGIGVIWNDGAFLASWGDALSDAPTDAAASEAGEVSDLDGIKKLWRTGVETGRILERANPQLWYPCKSIAAGEVWISGDAGKAEAIRRGADSYGDDDLAEGTTA